jgi:hypothetical protein
MGMKVQGQRSCTFFAKIKKKKLHMFSKPAIEFMWWKNQGYNLADTGRRDGEYCDD